MLKPVEYGLNMFETMCFATGRHFGLVGKGPVMRFVDSGSNPDQVTETKLNLHVAAAEVDISWY